MKKRNPFLLSAGVGAVVLSGMSGAAHAQTATMGVSVTVQQVVTVTSRSMSVTNLPVYTDGVVQVSAPTAATALGAIGGAAMGGGSVSATVGAFAFTRNAPIIINAGTVTQVMACRATGTSGGSVGVTIALDATSYATGGTAGTSCSSLATGACGVYVLPTLTFPSDMGTGGCTTATVTVPLTYATA